MNDRTKTEFYAAAKGSLPEKMFFALVESGNALEELIAASNMLADDELYVAMCKQLSRGIVPVPDDGWDFTTLFDVFDMYSLVLMRRRLDDGDETAEGLAGMADTMSACRVITLLSMRDVVSSFREDSGLAEMYASEPYDAVEGSLEAYAAGVPIVDILGA